jgi:uncharacterized protein (DUF697 family)
MPDTPTPSKSPIPVSDILIITHAILSGAAVLVPIAFVDDFLISAIRQNQVKVLAKYHQVTLSAEEVKLLASADSEGCWQGLLGVLKYPFKIVRQFIKVLEVKKSVETATHTYYGGILLNEVLRKGWYKRENFNKVHQAIQDTRRDVNKDLVREIFRSYLVINKKNYALLAAWGNQLLDYLFSTSRVHVRGWFQRTRLIRKAVLENPETLFERQPPQLAELARQIYENLNSNLLGIPQAQRQEMLERLAAAVHADENQAFTE